MNEKGVPTFPAGLTNGKMISFTQYSYIRVSCSVETSYEFVDPSSSNIPTSATVSQKQEMSASTLKMTLTRATTATSGASISGTTPPASSLPRAPPTPPPPAREQTPPSPPLPPPPSVLSLLQSPCQKIKIVKRQQISVAKLRMVFGNDVACICGHLNWLLSDTSLARDYLPLKDESLFDYLKDGVLLCAMANALEPGTVTESEVTRYPVKGPADVEPSRENVNLGLMSLKTLGVCMDTCEAPLDWALVYHRGTVILVGVLLQVIRLATVGRMNLKHHSRLVYMFDDWQDKEKDEVLNIKSLSRETVLLLWINYQLRKSGIDSQAKSLTSADSVICGHLLEAIAPKDKKATLLSAKNIAAETDQIRRAEMVVKNAEVLGLGDLIAPEHIFGMGKETSDPAKNLRVAIINSAFLARTFAAYPSIEEPAEPRKRLDPSISETLQRSCKRGASEETLMMWINSFGPGTPVVYLDNDLRSGIVLLQVWESITPGCVNWSKAEYGYLKMPRRKFVWLSNCQEVMNCAKKHNIRVNCSSADIATGEMTNTLALVFMMMLTHSKMQQKQAQKPGGKLPSQQDDKSLVQWFNKQAKGYGSNFELKDIDKDPSLKSTNALAFVAERVLSANCHAQSDCAGSCKSPAAEAKFKFNEVQPLPKEKLEDYSTVTISLLRKCGVTVYTSKISPDTDASVFRSLLQQLSSVASEE